ncbi:hypothetical protein [Hymenobacter negativus]|uniref:PH domain-containing protein n=1 Tax=Hymenobacter negativus TaxID=2795026 RepID=A0ABS3Q9H0_9BACT|nr:hypothetical protein [Hymenobacter negativus]MBO2007902.1 hypothetical protein [Hymenobacter negativus]
MPPSFAPETVVYLSRWKVPMWIMWFSLLSVGGTAMLLHKPLLPFAFSLSALKSLAGYAFGWVVVVVAAGCAGHYAMQLMRHQPVFRLGVLGIQLGTDPLDAWRSIWDEEVVVVRNGKWRTVSLAYRTPTAIRRLDVSDCGITAARLRKLLVYYRQQALHPTA